MILVTGFGPFGQVHDNPTARIARMLSGRRVYGETILSRVLPVSYARGLDQLQRSAAALDPVAVVGLGVATERHRICVERTAHQECGPLPDVDGAVGGRLDGGPPTVTATLDPRPFARALDADISDDAGRYLCNAWLYTAVTRLDAPSIFVHVPPSGLDPDRLCAALSAVMRLRKKRQER